SPEEPFPFIFTSSFGASRFISLIFFHFPSLWYTTTFSHFLLPSITDLLPLSLFITTTSNLFLLLHFMYTNDLFLFSSTSLFLYTQTTLSYFLLLQLPSFCIHKRPSPKHNFHHRNIYSVSPLLPTFSHSHFSSSQLQI